MCDTSTSPGLGLSAANPDVGDASRTCACNASRCHSSKRGRPPRHEVCTPGGLEIAAAHSCGAVYPPADDASGAPRLSGGPTPLADEVAGDVEQLSVLRRREPD